MAGVYIHVPYCKQACTYCDFYFSTNLSSKSLLLQNMVREIALRSPEFANQTITTVYFGGGTPSLLTAQELTMLLNALRSVGTIASDAEITLEANPDNLSPEYLNEIFEIGINRLSIGLQSFKNEELAALNRAHHAGQNTEVIKAAQQTGFKNITIDLIYGTPWSNEKEWETYLQTVIALGVQHISCYQLTVEEKTVLHHQIKKGVVPAPDDERTEKQFLILIDLLKQNGFVHYEVSNFGKPGFFSKHNTGYWLDVPYIGIGPAAHGYTGQNRYSNIANIHTYNKAIAEHKNWYTNEILLPKDIYNDMVLTGLRTIFGVDITLMAKKLDQSFVNYFQRKVNPYLEKGDVIKNKYTYTLQEKAFLFADKISADLFYI